MVDADAVRARLVADLKPVRRIASPARQMLLWMLCLAAVTTVLAAFADLPFVFHSLMIVPDMWIAELGAALTAVLSTIAAVFLSRPDRSPLWAALPVPSLVLWISASFVGSARILPLLAATHFDAMEAALYSTWVFGVSVPLSAATFWLLRRGYSLHPALTGSIAGLAVASSAAALMVLFHPDEAPLLNLAVHGSAVIAVMAGCACLGRYVFRDRNHFGR